MKKLKKTIVKLPQNEAVEVEFEDNDDLIIHEVYFNGFAVYNLLLSLNFFKGFNLIDYIFDELLRVNAEAKMDMFKRGGKK